MLRTENGAGCPSEDHVRNLVVEVTDTHVSHDIARKVSDIVVKLGTGILGATESEFSLSDL